MRTTTTFPDRQPEQQYCKHYMQSEQLWSTSS